MKNIEFIINQNLNEIAKAICTQFVEYAHCPEQYELQLFIDDNENVVLKTVRGNSSGNVVFDNDHYIVYRCGGDPDGPWSIIGDVYGFLDNEEKLDLLNDIAETLNINVRDISDMDVKAFIEENHPEWIDLWLNEVHTYYYDTGFCFVDDCIDYFLEKLDA